MDQEYKADVCCPRNTSAAEVDNSVEMLTHNNSVSKYLIYAILVQCFKMKYNVYVYKV
jgi:hypothetical protein